MENRHKKSIKTMLFAGLITTLASTAVRAVGFSQAERAQAFNQSILGAPSSSRYLDTEAAGPGGTRKFFTVLPGALYRGGGAGGQRMLNANELSSLCEAGFSLAVYAYDLGFRDPGPVDCVSRVTGQPNRLRYIAGASFTPAFKRQFLSEVKHVLENPSVGPVFVHCWNGMHASGELAAVALRQFCGWGGAKATAYWKRHAGGFAPITRVNTFSPYADLEVGADVQESVCTQQN